MAAHIFSLPHHNKCGKLAITTMTNVAQHEPGGEGPRVQVSIRIPKSIDRAVEITAAHRDVSKQSLIEEAIRVFLGAAKTDDALRHPDVSRIMD